MSNKKYDNQETKTEDIHEEVSETNSNHENELESLKKDNEELLAKIANLQLENKKLQTTINELNIDYVKKVEEKALEAQNKVNEIRSALMTEFEEKTKVEVKNKIDIYIEKKFDLLLNCINQLKIIVNTDVSNPDVRNYLGGFKLILDLFNRALNQMDINPISIQIGDQFDENIMEAFEVIDNGDVSSNCVCEILSTGYKYKDKVIKHSIVKIQK